MNRFTRNLSLGFAFALCLFSAIEAQAARVPIAGHVLPFLTNSCGLGTYSGGKSVAVYYRTVDQNTGQESTNRYAATIYFTDNENEQPHTSNGFAITTAGNWGFYVPDQTLQSMRIYEIDILEGTTVVENIRRRVPFHNGFINIKEFPYLAKGNGVADDTLAIQKAINDLAKSDGGRLYFPSGLYKVTSDTTHPLPFILPSRITIEGDSAGTYGPSRIQLATPAPTGQTMSIFKIQGCRERITIRDLTLVRDPSIAKARTIAVLASDTGNLATLEVLFSNMTFQYFDRGIEVNALDGGWQFDNVKVDHCTFTLNNFGIKMNTPNTDWNIVSSWFHIPAVNTEQGNPDAYGIYMANAGFILVQNTFGGGGRDFIHAKMVANLTVLNSQCEGSQHSLVFGDPRATTDNTFPDTGAFPALITLIGNQFGNPIDLNQRCTFISTSNHYGPQTVTATTKLARIHSTGDRFCYDGLIPVSSNEPAGNYGCNGTGGAGGFQGVGTVMFQTGQLGEYGAQNNYGVAPRPTLITGNTEIKDGDDFEVDPLVNGNKPLFSLVASTNINKPLLRIGQTTNQAYYDIKREPNGYLSIFGKQADWYKGVMFNGPIQLQKVTRTGLGQGDWSSTVTVGAILYCEDCAPSSNCSVAGDGATALRTSTGWRCN